MEVKDKGQDYPWWIRPMAAVVAVAIVPLANFLGWIAFVVGSLLE